ncbi:MULTISPECIES: HlyC/CorC family transporter [unclassified Polynucleobacter]|uniref:HlyC/CorC family transporter n=1 Tax=unclassified Polynucleobacter TaxID=2640945 RepID=UPI00249278C0|nr:MULTISPECIES: HlyC/CorC family transporter [unclassified Polynucleobacter]
MEDWPWWAKLAAVLLLLATSAFFSITETSMMAANRHRLKHKANQGHQGAKLANGLLGRTEELLSVILIGNNVINTFVPVLIAGIALHAFGNSGSVLSLTTALVAFLIIIFCEITPKVIGAAFPDQIASAVSWVIRPLVWVMTPLVMFVNIFVSALLKIMRLNTKNSAENRLSPEELRSLVLETSHFIPSQHRNILVNLFNLEHITVDDMMTPRARMETLDLSRPIDEVLHQMETCYHHNLPTTDQDPDRVIGILSVRKVVSLIGDKDLNHDQFKALLNEPYFIPSGTQVLQQIRFFQELQQRIGLVVDEYGVVLGLVTIEDIVEELIGEFTTSLPSLANKTQWLKDNTYIASGSSNLRDLNRLLGLHLPTDGPRTLNGLLIDILEEIPDNDISLKVADCVMEIIQFDQQSIKTVRIHRPPKSSMPKLV